jgi:hypothetical protein
VLVVRETSSELEHMILTTLLLAGVENTDNWYTGKGDLQCASLWTFRWFILPKLLIAFYDIYLLNIKLA